MVSVYGLTEAVTALAERNIRTSARSVERYIASGIVPAPARIGNRPIWDRDGIDQLAEHILAYRHSLRRGRFANA